MPIFTSRLGGAIPLDSQYWTGDSIGKIKSVGVYMKTLIIAFTVCCINCLPNPDLTRTGGDAQPRIIPDGGFYSAPVEVKIVSNSTNDNLVFTTNGAEPICGASPVYVAKFTITTSVIVKTKLCDNYSIRESVSANFLF
jgi:hypothetical protein